MSAAAKRRDDPSTWGEDQATPAELLAALGRRAEWFLDAIENMNGAGELAPGVRSLGARSGIDPSTAWRNRCHLAAIGILERDEEHDFYPRNGGRPTHAFRVTQRWLRAAFWLRGQLRPNWNQRWRPQLATVDGEGVNCRTATKGFAGRKLKPSTEPLESLTVDGKEEISKSEDAQLADIAAGEKPEAAERSSDASLHPRDAAALPEPRFRSIEARRRLPEPRPQRMNRVAGFTPKRIRQEKLGRFVADSLGSAACREFEEVMDRGGPEAQRLFDRIDALMIAAIASGWVDRP